MQVKLTMAVVVEYGREDIGVMIIELSCAKLWIEGVLVGEAKQSGARPTS